MSWIFPLFFFMLAIALVAYGMLCVRERAKPEEKVTCVLETRMREKFPHLTVTGRRDRVDYTLIFRTEGGDEISVSVTRAVYRVIPKQVQGELRHQGSRFLSFRFGDTVIDRKYQGSEDAQT
jgi:hypothetical protein